MLLDIFLGIPLIFTTLLGVRDGIVRKAAAIVAMIGGLILGQIYMRDVGNMLVQTMNVQPADAPVKGFLTIFLAVTLIQGLLYRLVARGYKIGGLADRIIGGGLGFAQGALFMSGLLMIYALQGIPSRSTARDSRLYKPIVNIAPQIVDFVTTVGPETNTKLEQMGTPEIPAGASATEEKSELPKDSSGVLNKEQQKRLFESARKSARK
ncbi:MAG: CvpA family protein [Bacteroidota bacterium]